MWKLKYKIVKNKTQYKEYCKTLEELVERNSKSKEIKEELELLTFLIEKWDEEHNSFSELDPIELLHSLMREHDLKPRDLVKILDVGKSMVSEILSYKKGLSKDVIRILSEYFKVSQEAFNRPYRIISPANSHLRNASVMNTTKELVFAHH